MNGKTIFRYILTTFLCLSLSCHPMPAAGGMQWPTTDEIAEAQRWLDSLPPDELEDIMQVATDYLDGLSEQERNELFQELDELIGPAPDQYGPPTQPMAPQKPTVVEPVKPQRTKEEQEKEAEQTRQAEQLAKAAHRAAQNIQAVLVTAAAIPDFKTDVDEWAEDQEIQPWQAGLTWELFARQLEQSIQSLFMVSRYDSIQQKYHYALLALDDQGLRKIIETLDESLTKMTANLSLERAGSPRQESHLKEALSLLAQAVIGQQLNEQLTKLKEKFEPEAKKLIAQQEETAQRAAQQTAIPRQPGRLIRAGQTITEEPYISKPAEQRGTRPGRAPATKPTKAPTLGGGRAKPRPAAGKGAKVGTGGEGAGTKPLPKPDKAKKKKDKSAKNGKSKDENKDKKDKKKDEDKDKKKQDKVAQGFLQSFESALVTLSSSLQTSGISDSFKKAHVSRAELERLAQQARAIESGTQKVRQAGIQLAERLKVISNESKQYYATAIKKQVDVSKKAIERFVKMVGGQQPDRVANVKTRFVFFTPSGTTNAAFADRLGQAPVNHRQQYQDWEAADPVSPEHPSGKERGALATRRIELQSVAQGLKKVLKEITSIK